MAALVKKALVFAVTLTLLFAALPATASAGLLQAMPTQVAPAKDQIGGVRVGRGIITWTQRVGNTWTVWVHRADGTVRDITAFAGTIEHRAPTIAAGRWVVYAATFGGTYEFIIFDDVTGEANVLPVASKGSGIFEPTADGNRLAWVRRETNGDYSLVTGVLTGTPTALADVTTVRTFGSGVTVSNLSLSGTLLGYLRRASGDDFAVDDVSGGGTTFVQAVSTLNSIGTVAVSRKYFGFNVLQGGIWHVYAWSRVNGGATAGTVDTVAGFPALRYPSFSGDNVAYCYADVPGGSQKAHFWNVPSGRRFLLATGGDVDMPSLDGRFAAYVQHAGGPSGPATVMQTAYYLQADRVSGDTRYDTAAEAARSSYPAPGGWAGVTHVVIASGETRSAADPLAAAGLCWKYDAPLLLTRAGGLPASTATVLQEIKAANPAVKVLVVGGPGAVPETRLTDMRVIVGATNVSRVYGPTRYDTAAEIAKVMRLGPGGKAFPAHPMALIANGADPNKFVDALALSAVSRSTGFPILLVGLDVVPTATKDALTAMPVHGVIVGGGGGSVSAAVYTAVGGGARWSGADRYQTAESIAVSAIIDGYSIPTSVALTSNVVDGLAGGAMVGRDRGVLLLSKPELPVPPSTADFLQANATDILSSRIMGGTGVVANLVQQQLNLLVNPSYTGD